MIEKLMGSFAKRPAPKRGPISSEDYNNSWDEIFADLNALVSSWNQYLQPLLDSLPEGDSQLDYDSRDHAQINPFVNGLDGSQLFMDQTATTKVDDGYYYDGGLLRPLTVKEAVEKVKGDLAARLDSLDSQVAQIDAATGLTTYQKGRLGANIFNEEETSTSDSLDGLTQQYLKWFNQLAADIFNETSPIGTVPGYVYTTTGRQTLGSPSASKTIMGWIKDLDTRTIALGSGPIDQIRITDLGTDLTHIRDVIGRIKDGGATAWDLAPGASLKATSDGLAIHAARTDNPHSVTWAQVGGAAAETKMVNIKTILWAADPNLGDLARTNTSFVGAYYIAAETDYHGAIVALASVMHAAEVAMSAALLRLSNRVGVLEGYNLDVRVTALENYPQQRYYLSTNMRPNGIATSFGFVDQVLLEEIPMLASGGYWPGGSTIVFDLAETPRRSIGQFFVGYDVENFVNDVYDTGLPPLYPGDYLVIDAQHFAIYGYGAVGEVHVIAVGDTYTPGFITYYKDPANPALWAPTIEIFKNGIIQLRGRDWYPNSLTSATSVTFTTAPAFGSTIVIHGSK